MAGKTYPLTPKKVPAVRTKNRRIVTPIPVPESIPLLKELRKYEPLSMSGQPLVFWDKAKDCYVFDKWGNKWLDMSSGVLVANAGHSRKEIVDAICKQARKSMLHNYCFPSEIRGQLAKRIVDITPKALDKCFLLTTGAETTECAIKLMRTHGQKVGGKKKIGIISFNRGFHGRTMGSQMIGGSPGLKDWIVNVDKSMWQVPFPDGYWVEDTSFELFLKSLKKLKVTPDKVAGVIVETYQGGNASFAPKKYMQELSKWCKKNKIILTCDEVQAGFGRTGKLWGFEHYSIVPDLVCFGKGISSGLPLSAIVGRKALMDLYPPGSMTSTHTGNPVCAASALANIDLIVKEKLAERAAKLGTFVRKELDAIQAKYSERVGCVQGRGLVFSLHIVKPIKRKEPDSDFAFEIIRRCVEKGLLFFSPVGDSAVKVSPPLIVTKEQMTEALAVLDEAIGEVIAESK